MNKKILIFGALAALMLVTISFATAIQTTNTQKRESPLFNIRAKLAIGEKLQNLKVKFIGERLFFIPSQWSSKGGDRSARQRIVEKTESNLRTSSCYYTCNPPTWCPDSSCTIKICP